MSTEPEAGRVMLVSVTAEDIEVARSTRDCSLFTALRRGGFQFYVARCGVVIRDNKSTDSGRVPWNAWGITPETIEADLTDKPFTAVLVLLQADIIQAAKDRACRLPVDEPFKIWDLRTRISRAEYESLISIAREGDRRLVPVE